MARKYLVLGVYGHVAIPLEMLQVCGSEIRILEMEWAEKSNKVIYFNKPISGDGRLIEEKDILDREPESPNEATQQI